MNEYHEDSGFYFIKLLTKYVMHRINLQHILYFFAFVTFDVGDAVTGSIMMDSNGIGAEYNGIIKYIYMNDGLLGLIAAKLCFIILPIVIGSMIYKHSYWMINGILVALIVYGILAVQANMQAIAGQPSMSPEDINMIYIKVLLLLLIAGNIIDSHISKREKEKIFSEISVERRVISNNLNHVNQSFEDSDQAIWRNGLRLQSK